LIKQIEAQKYEALNKIINEGGRKIRQKEREIR
jgi:hypothetical protein